MVPSSGGTTFTFSNCNRILSLSGSVLCASADCTITGGALVVLAGLVLSQLGDEAASVEFVLFGETGRFPAMVLI